MIKPLSLNKVNFTAREVDVLSCIIAGRAVKKIASFLSITPKTVENHIVNIKTKIKGRSREHIVDFVEQSDKYSFVKEHYLNLSIKKKFVLVLQKFAMVAKSQDQKFNCELIRFDSNNKNDTIARKITEHLSVCGVNITTSSWNDSNVHNYFSENTNPSNNYIIYIISKEFIKHIEENKLDLSHNLSNTIAINKISAKNVFFLLSDISKDTFSHIKISGYMCLDLTTQANYFFSFFRMLEMFIPNHAISKDMSGCQEQYAKMYDQVTRLDFTDNGKPLRESPRACKLHQQRKKIISFQSLLIIIIIFLGFYIIFYLITVKHSIPIDYKKQRENIPATLAEPQACFNASYSIFISTHNKFNLTFRNLKKNYPQNRVVS